MPATRRILSAAAALAAAALPVLADHDPYGAIEPTADEQLGIYELNRARNDPPAYGAEIGFDLSAVAAAPPLAVNRNLTGSAHFHAQVMFDHHEYGHVSTLYGIGANQMAVDNGYDLFGNGLGASYGTANSIESIMRSVNQVATTPAAVKTFVIDKDVVGAGHRVHLLALAAGYLDHREIGFGWAAGTDSFPEFGLPKPLPTKLCAIHTAYRSTADRFITGVVFRDANGNLRYDRGEGLGGVTVSIQGGASTTSMEHGGYSLATSPGSRLVTCSGGPFAGTAAAMAVVGGGNVAVDFHSGRAGGEVDFAFRGGVLPPGPEVAMTASPSSGGAPLSVEFAASGATEGIYTWDFGDGETATGGSPENTYEEAGFYPALVTGVNSAGAGTALRIITVSDGSLLPGGMTPPADSSLDLAKGLLKRVIKVPGKDQAKLTGSLELPGGFLPDTVEVQVCVAGAIRTFTLDAKGKGALPDGSKIVLKAKWPKDGGGVPAGTVAKVTATLKGDFGARLEAMGLRDRTETRTVDYIPCGVLLHGRTWTVQGTMVSKAVAGKTGKATITAAD